MNGQMTLSEWMNYKMLKQSSKLVRTISGSIVFNPGDARLGYPSKVSLINWLAPGAWLHLQELAQQGLGEMCFNGSSLGHPLRCEGT